MPEYEYPDANRFVYYTDLHYIPEKKKEDPLWAASCLLFSKYNSVPLVDPARAAKFRSIDDGELYNRAAYKKVFDPPTPDGKTGGQAKYLAADWQANPVYIHINNIVEANMEKIPLNLYCKAVDEYAMLKQQKENMKILGRNEFRKFLNEMNKKLGFPALKNSDDPFKYAAQMQSKAAPQTKTGSPVVRKQDLPTSLLDSIMAAIDDNEDLALFNEYIYKGDVEIAIELGQAYYFQKNKWNRISDRIIPDIRNFNTACARWYTSLTSGRPMMEYMDCALVNVSPFNEPDGRDITYWFIEYDVTFGDFVKMMGRNKSTEDLEKIFEQNKNNQAMHGLSWDKCTSAQRAAARIRIGYTEWQSQNCEVYAESRVRGNLSYKKKDLDWQPNKYASKESKAVRDEKHYNVWYKCYYIPMRKDVNVSSGFTIDDFVWQSNYIFDFGKVQDQQRYGDDDRNAECSLVVWKRKGMSFAEIMDRYMPKIHIQWQKYQNYIVQNDVYSIFANKLMEAMMQISDEGDKKSVNADKMEWLKMLTQTGKGVADFTDAQGNQIDPVKVFKVGYMNAAIEALQSMKLLYDQMTLALSISDTREGIDPKPRTSLGGIQLSLAASNNGTYFIEKGYMDMILEMSNRMLYYMYQIVQEGDSKRLQEFKDVVGNANGMALEAIADIPKHKLGFFIDNVNTDQQKQFLVGLATEMVKAGQLDMEALHLIIKVDNYKYAAVLMLMKHKQKIKQLEQQKEIEFQRLMASKDKDLEIVRQQFISKEEAKTISIDRAKEWDMKIKELEVTLKSQNQAMIKEMIKNNRIEEKVADSQLQKQEVA